MFNVIIVLGYRLLASNDTIASCSPVTASLTYPPGKAPSILGSNVGIIKSCFFAWMAIAPSTNLTFPKACSKLEHPWYDINRAICRYFNFSSKSTTMLTSCML